MVELMVLGFLAEGPLHGYELRRRMERLHGYARLLSYGTLYPAIARLVAAGLVAQEPGQGRGAAKVTLHLTAAGRTELVARLRDTSGTDVTDGHRFMVVLAFLSHVPGADDRDAVLRRRLGFLTHPASFFTDGERQLRADDIADPYRRGVVLVARATSRAERAWLSSMLTKEES